MLDPSPKFRHFFLFFVFAIDSTLIELFSTPRVVQQELQDLEFGSQAYVWVLKGPKPKLGLFFFKAPLPSFDGNLAMTIGAQAWSPFLNLNLTLGFCFCFFVLSFHATIVDLLLVSKVVCWKLHKLEWHNFIYFLN